MWNNKKFWGKNNLKYDEGFVGNFVFSVIFGVVAVMVNLKNRIREHPN